jgi:hypothetical protein
VTLSLLGPSGRGTARLHRINMAQILSGAPSSVLRQPTHLNYDYIGLFKMSVKVLGGYLLTFPEAANAARKLGLSWNPNNQSLFGCHAAIIDWIDGRTPKLLKSHSLRRIFFEESGQVVVKLIFPTDWTSQKQDSKFRYAEGEGGALQLRESARKLGMPDEFFGNFVTVFDPCLGGFIEPHR